MLTHPEKCKDKFTAARWEDWKKDVDWFYHSSVGSYWDNMQKDHGYNPPPVWGMTGKLFASIAPAGDTFFKILSMIDVGFHVGVVLLFYWAFGFRIMAIATVFWGCNAPANFYWTGGAFLRQDWLFLLVAAVCCARKRKFGLAGAALTWSALLRVFPIIFFGGWGIMVVYEVIRRIPLRHDRGSPGRDGQAFDQARARPPRLPAPRPPPFAGWRPGCRGRADSGQHRRVRRGLLQTVLRSHDQGARHDATDQHHGTRDHARAHLGQIACASCETTTWMILSRVGRRAGSRNSRRSSRCSC